MEMDSTMSNRMRWYGIVHTCSRSWIKLHTNRKIKVSSSSLNHVNDEFLRKVPFDKLNIRCAYVNKTESNEFPM